MKDSIKKDLNASALVVLRALEKEAKPLQKKLDALVIETQEDYTRAGKWLKDLKELRKQSEAKKQTILRPLKEAEDATRELFAPFEETVTEYERNIKSEMLQWWKKVERKKQRVVKAYEEDRPIAAGLLGSLDNSSSYSQARTKKVYSYDVDKIPRMYLQPNEAAIKAAIKAGKKIPGVTVTDEKIMAV